MTDNNSTQAQPLRYGGDSVTRGVLYMCIAAAIFPILNTTVKYLGQRYPMPELFVARYLGHVVYCLIAFLPWHGRALFRSARPKVQVLRALLLFGASACYFLGLLTVDLPTSTAITFVGPIIVTALSVPMLGERVGLRRWTAVAVGFAGALIIIRPGANVAHWGAVLVLLDALCYAIYQVLSRKIGSQDPAQTSITLAGMGGLLLALLTLPFASVKLPASLFDLALFFSLGLWGLLGHYFVIKAYQWSRASIIAPIGYAELVGSTLLGFLVFSEFPDRWTWLGASIIVASGLYITYREQRLRRLAKPESAA